MSIDLAKVLALPIEERIRIAQSISDSAVKCRKPSSLPKNNEMNLIVGLKRITPILRLGRLRPKYGNAS